MYWFFFLNEESSLSLLSNEKTFDTNTFVLKRKERRKVTTPANENSFNGVSFCLTQTKKKTKTWKYLDYWWANTRTGY